MNPSSKARIYLLYSSKDEVLCTWICSYLNELKLNGSIGRYSTISIESLNTSGSDREKICQSRDILLLLASPNFLKSDFVPSPVFHKILDRHFLRRNLLLPLFFFESGELPQRMRKLPRLQNNNSTIVYHNNSELHQQLGPIFKEIAPIAAQWERYNAAIDEAWGIARQEHSYDGYQFFLNNYPRCVHAAKAKKLEAELKEEKLWKEALSFNQMEYYFKYLSESPFKKYEEACILKILEFQSKQDVAQVDAIKNKSIPLALNFKAKYDPKNQTPAIDQHLFQLFNQKEELEKASMQTESFYLQQQALQNSTPEEVFELQLSLQYGKHLERRLSQLVAKLRSFYMGYLFAVALAVLAFGYLFFYNALSIFQPGKTSLSLFLAYIFLVYTAYRCLIGSSHAEHRMQEHEELLKQVKKDHIYLQIATINRDKLSSKRILFQFANINFNLIPYEEASIFSFIQRSEELEQQQEGRKAQADTFREARPHLTPPKT